MEKFLVTIDFTYSQAPKSNYDCTSKKKIITIGVYDTFKEAAKHGNKVLEKFESKYPLHVYTNGQTANKERFNELGGKYDLISNMGYLKTPFSFYAKITTLKYDSIDNMLDEITIKHQEYIDWRKRVND